MWSIAAFHQNHMADKNLLISKNKHLETTNQQLVDTTKQLQDELEFYKSLINSGSHYNSLVGNMCIKYIKGQPYWIDMQKIKQDKTLLYSLDKDNQVLQWIKELDIKYKDSDW
tara:strand:+ start:542 stop:880 length:339 start_codon:yes stop_codon:yes gene_type:complete